MLSTGAQSRVAILCEGPMVAWISYESPGNRTIPVGLAEITDGTDFVVVLMVQ